MLLPSGAKRAPESASGWLVSRRTPVPSVAATQMSRVSLFASRSEVATVKATSFPSGETAESPTRWNESMSSTVKGCRGPLGIAPGIEPAAASRLAIDGSFGATVLSAHAERPATASATSANEDAVRIVRMGRLLTAPGGPSARAPDETAR